MSVPETTSYKNLLCFMTEHRGRAAELVISTFKRALTKRAGKEGKVEDRKLAPMMSEI